MTKQSAEEAAIENARLNVRKKDRIPVAYEAFLAGAKWGDTNGYRRAIIEISKWIDENHHGDEWGDRVIIQSDFKAYIEDKLK
jgi:hypothetical protein